MPKLNEVGPGVNIPKNVWKNHRENRLQNDLQMVGLNGINISYPRVSGSLFTKPHSGGFQGVSSFVDVQPVSMQ